MLGVASWVRARHARCASPTRKGMTAIAGADMSDFRPKGMCQQKVEDRREASVQSLPHCGVTSCVGRQQDLC